MIEDDGALRDAHRGTGKSFKVEKAVAGSIIAFAVDKKTYGIGMVFNVSRVEGKYILHKYGPTSDGRLSIRWRPLYYAEDGSEDYHGSDPVKVTVMSNQVLMLTPLNKDGAVTGQPARALDLSQKRIADPVAEPDIDGLLRPLEAQASL